MTAFEDFVNTELPLRVSIPTSPPGVGHLKATGVGKATSYVKDNLSASSDPTVNDDSSAGYSVDSRWINTTADKVFICADAGVGAAVWKEAGGGGGVSDHGALTGLGDDDHSQYHNDARGDARYYTESELDAGQLDNRYFTESEHLNASAGAGDAGKPIKLDADGQVDATMINDGDVDHANLANVTADQHHAQSHSVASHSDTTATGAELETLTDGSDADALHAHALNDTHRTSDGSDHSFIDQNVTGTATPIFASLTLEGNLTFDSSSATIGTTSGTQNLWINPQKSLILGSSLTDDVKIGNVSGVIPCIIQGTTQLRFRDSGLYITSSADGQLDIDADVKVEITAPTVEVNGALVVGGDVDVQDNSLGFTQQTITYNSGTTTADWGKSNKAKMTFGAGNITTFAFTNPPKPCNLILQIKQDGTGGRTVGTWDADIKWPGGTAPTLSTGANAIDILSFYWDGTNYFGQAALDFS